jgi:uncharacterized cupin superfamily protein
MHEAPLRETETGLVPEGDGWFIANVRDLSWNRLPANGIWCEFEDPDDRSPQLGIGVHVLEPGQSSALYHYENDDEEGFLILEGECLLVVEGQERTMRQWDYFRCPPRTAHITIGAGEGLCAILMVGVRTGGGGVYPVDPVAARHGASVDEETDDSKLAYKDRAGPQHPERAPWPPAG